MLFSASGPPFLDGCALLEAARCRACASRQACVRSRSGRIASVPFLDGCALLLEVSRYRAHAPRGLAFAAAHGFAAYLLPAGSPTPVSVAPTPGLFWGETFFFTLRGVHTAGRFPDAVLESLK